MNNYPYIRAEFSPAHVNPHTKEKGISLTSPTITVYTTECYEIELMRLVFFQDRVWLHMAPRLSTPKTFDLFKNGLEWCEQLLLDETGKDFLDTWRSLESPLGMAVNDAVSCLSVDYASNFGVHEGHCCSKHGCKYGTSNCPVVNKKHPGVVCEECSKERTKGFPYPGPAMLEAFSIGQVNLVSVVTILSEVLNLPLEEPRHEGNLWGVDLELPDDNPTGLAWDSAKKTMEIHWPDACVLVSPEMIHFLPKELGRWIFEVKE